MARQRYIKSLPYGEHPIWTEREFEAIERALSDLERDIGASGYTTVEDESTPVTARSTMNFTGAGVSVADTGGKTTVTIAGGAGHDPVTVTDSASINFTLTGQDVTAVAIFGTGSGTVAEGNHSHAQLHDRSHAMTGTSDHTATNWRVFYSNGSGQVAELALGSSGTYLKSNGASSIPSFEAPTASVAISTASVAFTDGDTARRVTVTDAAVSATSKILCSIMRPTTTDDSADQGYVYDANVVKRDTGSFDVYLRCTDIGGEDCTERPPNETVTLCYQVAA